MIWPRLSLTGKLFVAVVVPVLLAVGLMAVALDYSTRQGFTRYLLESELTGLEGLSEALKTDPRAAQGWPDITSYQDWIGLIHRSVPGPPEPPSLLPNRPPSGPSGRNRAEPEIHPIPLPDRLVLLSAGGSVLAGRHTRPALGSTCLWKTRRAQLWGPCGSTAWTTHRPL